MELYTLRYNSESDYTDGLFFIDDDFDISVIAHEYGHGISTRLAGGRNNSGCLGNDEQMGEGWSDWLALVTTARASDTRTQPRPIAPYLLGQPQEGNGFRLAPYHPPIF